MGLLDVADYAAPDELTKPAVTFLTVTLVAHLGGGFGLTGHGAQLAGFGDVVGERLLAIHGFAQLHGHHGGQRVVVVGRGNADRVNLLADLVEHHAVISEDLDLVRVRPLALKPLLYSRMPFLVGVHNGYQILLALFDQPFEVIHAASAAADLDAIELAARGRSGEKIGDRQETTRGHRAGGQRTVLKKRATVQCKLHSRQQLQFRAQRLRLAHIVAGPIKRLNSYRAFLTGWILPPALAPED